MLRTSHTKLVSSGLVVFALLFMIAMIFAPAASAAAPCESLTSLKLPNTTITAAVGVAAGAFVPAPAPGGRAGRGGGKGGGGNPYAELPAFCRVEFTVKPSSDSDIKVEIWLPATGWNNKFEANGNGGFSGSITPNTLAAGVRLGYATSMTDTGHEGGSASFALGHPEKVIDFGYRSVHEMAVQGKAIIKAFYGEAPKYSYWNGCSAGGRQGMIEAQRYPEDFDGIVAGSPGLNWTGRAVLAIAIGQAVHKEEASLIPPAKFAAIHKAAVEACDAKDGVKDGIIENPKECKFDPGAIECKGADGPDCLTSAQVATAKAIYAPVVNTRTKKVAVPGFEPGSELGWNTMAGANPFGIGVDLMRDVVFQDPNWDYKTFNFGSDLDKAYKEDAASDALDPNLKAFVARGGKLISYHGWTDPQISPGSTAMYYDSVLKTMGKKIEDNYRLFMVPGMNHCGGGEGATTFDMLSALTQWVEQKKAPDQIIATKAAANGQPERSHPLCPYPEVAVYKGSGSPDDAANFSCKAK